MTLGGLAGAARCRFASRRGEEHRGHDRRQIVSCGWVSIHLVVNDGITKDRTRAHSPAVSAGQHVSLLCGRPGNVESAAASGRGKPLQHALRRWGASLWALSDPQVEGTRKRQHRVAHWLRVAWRASGPRANEARIRGSAGQLGRGRGTMRGTGRGVPPGPRGARGYWSMRA